MKSIALWVGIALFGIVGSVGYYHWMFLTSLHVLGLQYLGLFGYWVSVALPALTLFMVMIWYSLRADAPIRLGLVVASFLASALIPLLSLFGPFLFCLVFTPGTCE
jgi:hypothetical protein